jgi:choline/carnitine/betaine transport
LQIIPNADLKVGRTFRYYVSGRFPFRHIELMTGTSQEEQAGIPPIRRLMGHLLRLLRWTGRNAQLLIALPVTGAIAAVGLQQPGILAQWAALITDSVFRSIDWFFLTLTTGVLIMCIWLGLGRYGNVKLGQPDEQPEFSTLSWLSMLFAAGMGVGLLYWGVAEPVLHYATAPGVERGSTEAARHAMTVSLFHWGLHGWAIFCVVGLALGYFGFRRQTSYMPGSCMRSALTGWWVAPVAWLADLIALLAVVLGVGGSIAMGVFQLERGIEVAIPLDFGGLDMATVILAALLVAYLPPLALPLDKGIKWVSNLNMVLALVVLVYVLTVGPTAFLTRSFLTAFGDYVTQMVPLSFELFPFQAGEASEWLRSWTLTYFIWVMAWTPFVGIFIARISRGRTIREFVAGVLLVPSIISIIWFTVFGGAALYEERFGAGGLIAIIRHDVSIALFSLFERLPNTGILSIAAIILAFIFLVTSVISAAYVLGMLSEHGSLSPSVWVKLGWGIALAGIGAAMMLSGDIQAVRSITIVGAIPFAFVMVLQIVSLVRALGFDSRVEPDPITAAEHAAQLEQEMPHVESAKTESAKV